MKTDSLSELYKITEKLNGELYKKYKAIQGVWSSQKWTLIIEKVQVESSAPPSLFRIRVPNLYAGFPKDLISNPISSIPLSDFMLRQFVKLSKKISHHSGSGKSGIFYPESPGNEILDRSIFHFSDNFVEISFRYGLPGNGNRIDSENFIKSLDLSFTKIVSHILTWDSYDLKEITDYLNYYADHETLRNLLIKNNLIAFVPNGAVIPRESSVSLEPLKDAVPFISPTDLKYAFDLPHKGKISGMGIPKGITFITGGGFHGKTTLLDAIKIGIYTHIPGDGREFLVSDISTFKINSENGRYATNIDITPFINNLPFGKDSSGFSSLQCSGSTSQAATTIESIRMDSKCLLFDEDSSSTNFLICDEIMEKILGEKDKTITPLLQTARDIYTKLDVSFIIVIGSIGSNLGLADLILKMSEYKPYNITQSVKTLLSETSQGILEKNFNKKALASGRFADSDDFRILKRKKPFSLKVISRKQIQVEHFTMDFFQNEQIVEIGQAKTILQLLINFEELVFKKRYNFETAVKQLFSADDNNSIIHKLGKTDLAQIRPLDLAYALNRFRLLKLK